MSIIDNIVRSYKHSLHVETYCAFMKVQKQLLGQYKTKFYPGYIEYAKPFFEKLGLWRGE